MVGHLRAAGKPAERVRATQALSRRGRSRPPVLLGRACARAPVNARRGRPRPVKCRLRLGIGPLWLANVRDALARLRALAQRAELTRLELLAAGLERALFVVAVGVHDELGAGGREAPLDAVMGVAAAAHDAAVGVARPDIRVLHEGDYHGRGRGLCAGCELGGGEREKLRDPGIDGLRLGLLQHVCPVARLVANPARLGRQSVHDGLVAQHLRERAVLVGALRAEHLARASPVAVVRQLGRLRANGACGARCALLLLVPKGECEAVRHCCGVGVGVGVCVWMWLSNQSEELTTLIQIFLFFERKTHIRCARTRT